MDEEHDSSILKVFVYKSPFLSNSIIPQNKIDNFTNSSNWILNSYVLPLVNFVFIGLNKL